MSRRCNISRSVVIAVLALCLAIRIGLQNNALEQLLVVDEERTPPRQTTPPTPSQLQIENGFGVNVPQQTASPSQSPTAGARKPLPENREKVTEMRREGVTLLPLGQTMPECKKLTHSLHYTNKKVYQKDLKIENAEHARIGNALGPYWCARTMAQLGGYEYDGSTSQLNLSFLRFLPRKVPPQRAQREIYNYVCDTCSSIHNPCEKFHKCYPGWLALVHTIRQDTQMALREYGASRPTEEAELVFQQFQPNDWLLYERCCITCDRSHGFANLRVYEYFPKDEAYTIYTLRYPSIHEDLGLCEDMHRIRNAYLRQLYPQIQIVELDRHLLWVDFGRLVFAPNVLVPSVGSSWILWSALLANSGRVLTPPPISEDVSFVGDNYRFTVLYNVSIMNRMNQYFPDHEDSLASYQNNKTVLEEKKKLILDWFMDGVQIEGSDLL